MATGYPPAMTTTSPDPDPAVESNPAPASTGTQSKSVDEQRAENVERAKALQDRMNEAAAAGSPARHQADEQKAPQDKDQPKG